MIKNIVPLLLILISVTNAQSILTIKKLHEFSSASSFSINSRMEFFISDSETNEIIKLDSTGNMLARIGGYGWDQLTFDNPADVFATTLDVIVADMNNNRLQILDKDLNFLSYFQANDSEENSTHFSYPKSVALSATGDIFILDSDNYYIVKYNYNGSFIQIIGAENAGGLELEEPAYITFTGNNLLAAADGNYIKLFDEFGNAVRKIQLEIKPVAMSRAGKMLIINSNSEIIFLDLSNNKMFTLNAGEFELQNIRKVIINGNKLYILTEKYLFESVINELK